MLVNYLLSVIIHYKTMTVVGYSERIQLLALIARCFPSRGKSDQRWLCLKWVIVWLQDFWKAEDQARSETFFSPMLQLSCCCYVDKKDCLELLSFFSLSLDIMYTAHSFIFTMLCFVMLCYVMLRYIFFLLDLQCYSWQKVAWLVQ